MGMVEVLRWWKGEGGGVVWFCFDDFRLTGRGVSFAEGHASKMVVLRFFASTSLVLG